MGLQVTEIVVAARDPEAQARFWAGLLGWSVSRGGWSVAAVSAHGLDLPLHFEVREEPKRGLDRTHLDLTSRSPEHQRELVDRALAGGATHLDVGQGPDADHVVLADPEGNEFCVIESWNAFLTGTGAVGALAGSGSRATGVFWSGALGWPLVWDQDDETAVQHPDGGPKITWGGEPVAPKQGPNRLQLTLEVSPGGRLVDEVDRLLQLGGTRADDGPSGARGSGGAVPMCDPDGNELWLRPPHDD
ncbi:VOC family protein [Terracoccus luteus]|uniref:VOC domain-containing protein n=1 Tax=Terracoccus luteus TaxID=53356 RepID=A0A839PN99_9MICO|nr:VOC family protein [Terracoccus luteus]MBB2984977.1 hypothetical protein [Terracoccus luteus]MCP2170629.1 hypothetical protein [Terracoccus luteus]